MDYPDDLNRVFLCQQAASGAHQLYHYLANHTDYACDDAGVIVCHIDELDSIVTEWQFCTDCWSAAASPKRALTRRVQTSLVMRVVGYVQSLFVEPMRLGYRPI